MMGKTPSTFMPKDEKRSRRRALIFAIIVAFLFTFSLLAVILR